ncbi:MAG: hypothetical protein JWR26_3507 [Pedosphaera sp.]|nr:hypothetical protein [Pedosphaera sp.]
MKILTNKGNSGVALVAALVVSAVMGIAVCSYLVLVGNRNYITQRSESWNTAIPVLEAGIEEAFTHLHYERSSLAANGWAPSGTGASIVYQKRRDFTNTSTYYLVTISNVTSTTADIYSQGFVPSASGSGYISRKVQIRATNALSFSKAVAAKGVVSFSGSSTVDSFNSSDPHYSTNGMYDPSMHRANGGVVTDSSATPAIKVGTGRIYGTVDTGPTGTVTTGSGGGVGDLAWTTNGIESGYISHDMNVTYPDNTVPTGSSGWLPPLLGIVGGTNYQYVLGTGNYKLISALSISQSGNGQPVIVTGNATLYVTGNLTVSGSGFIYMAPGSSLTLIVGGTTSTISGGGVVNGTGYASNFSYIGLPTNTSLTYSGSAAFIGTVNAPEADFTISGSAGMSGAAIVNSLTDSGGSSIHYDESLGSNSIFVMNSYTEL